MLVSGGFLQCLVYLLSISDVTFGDASSLEMKDYLFRVRRTDRSIRAIGSCKDINDNEVTDGKYYVPKGDNACQHCKCMFGQPGDCYVTKCAKPTCKNYKAVAGQCCRFTCPEETSNNTQLAVIISLSLGLLILVILLVVVITRNIKKNRQRNNRQQQPRQPPPVREEQGEQRRNNNISDSAPLNNQLPTIQEEQERHFEPPPPYTPVRNANKVKTRHTQHSTVVIPNEPPPPYEIQASLQATTV